MTLSRPAVLIVTALVMAAFAANSVLARLALITTDIDAASFSAVRLLSGAAVLLAVVRLRPRSGPGGRWRSAWALFVYVVALSYAYLSLSTGTGALLLFGSVQVTMIGAGLWAGERMSPWGWAGFALAVGGLVALLAPGVTSPPLLPAVTMVASGVAWGLYSLAGRRRADPVGATAGNFVRASLLGLGLAGVMAVSGGLRLDPAGLGYAALSGAVTSGLGYVAWYTVLPSLRSASAATVQLSVPVLAALGGVLFVGEPPTARFMIASAVTLGGIALVVRSR